MIATIIVIVLFCVQISVLILLLRRNDIRMQDKGFLGVMLIVHPILWKRTDDCGEHLLSTTVLFFVLSIVLWRLALYRSKVANRLDSETEDQNPK